LKRKLTVDVKALSTVAALEALSKGNVELVGTTRPADARTAAEATLEFIPVAWDSIVLVTHPSNPVANVSLKQARDIYFGRIKNWQQVGGPAKPINLYANAAPLDGVEYSLRKTLFGRGDALVAANRWYINTKQLEDAVAIDPAAIGATTLSNVIANPKLKRLSIENVVPSIASLEDGRYVLATPLYVAARREQAGSPSSMAVARAALDFFNTETTLHAEWRKRQLVPYRDAKKLADALPAREAWIANELGIKPPTPPGPPMPPAPRKNKELNRVHGGAEVAIAAREAKEVAPHGKTTNAFKATERFAYAACRPQPACVKPAAPKPANAPATPAVAAPASAGVGTR